MGSAAYIIASMLLVPFILHVDGQLPLPQNPCPLMFQYKYDPIVGHMGHLTIPNPRTGLYDLEVNVSLAKYVEKKNIQLKLSSNYERLNQESHVEYDVLFPEQDVLPKLTQVKYNGQVICAGPPEPLTPGKSVTNMWSKTTLKIQSSGGGGGPPPPPLPPPQPMGYPPPGFYPPPGGYPPMPPGYGPSPNGFDGSMGYSGFRNRRYDTDRITADKKESKKSVDQCGIAGNSQSLIIGGEKTHAGDFPWLAAILYREESTYKFKCTANLISDRHVITSGHCLRYFNAPLIDNEDLVVVLGKYNIENWAHSSVIRNAKDVIVNPHYKQNNADSDIAIVLLNEPVTFGPNVRPVCLWSGEDSLDSIVGREGTVAGWGKSGDGVDYSPVAKTIRMPIVSQEKCLRSNKVYKKLTSSKTFCAGTRNGKGPCSGDSGAGLLLQDGNTQKWLLRGLTGFSLKDEDTLSCDLNNYIVFTDVAKVHRWIKEVVNDY